MKFVNIIIIILFSFLSNNCSVQEVESNFNRVEFISDNNHFFPDFISDFFTVPLGTAGDSVVIGEKY